MTKRERVEAAMNLQKVDRTPLYDLVRNDAILEYFGGEKLTVENGLRVAARAIGNWLDMTRDIAGPSAPGLVESEDWPGFRHRVERWTSWIVGRPFRDYDEFVPWVEQQVDRLRAWRPDSGYRERFRRQFETLQAMTDDTVILLTNSATVCCSHLLSCGRSSFPGSSG
ncbi:MAG TPA: hypothetical protein EYP04_05655 [Anaerolineae bacterium]|nr:hypothetical protein [Anaerolineae bacterium]HIQ04842.1 hypothetical protein [Anaerolineae bacterium]